MLVDKDEASRIAVAIISVVEKGRRCTQRYSADIIKMKIKVVFNFVKGIDVDLIPDIPDYRFDFVGCMAKNVLASRNHRSL